MYASPLPSILSRDIYALCEAFPESYSDRLFAETENLLVTFVDKLLEVRPKAAYAMSMLPCAFPDKIFNLGRAHI